MYFKSKNSPTELSDKASLPLTSSLTIEQLLILLYGHLPSQHANPATTQLNFPFSSQVQLIPVLLCSTWSTEITTRQTQGSLISPRHHLHEEASSSPSHNILTPKNTVLKHPLVCWRPRTVPFLFIPAHVKHVHEGWRSFSTPIPAQTLKTESSSCHKMFFTRSSSAVSSAKGCIPYPSGQTAAWVTLSWELRLNRGAVLAGLQWWTCPQPHCERCFYLKGCNYSPTQLILTMRDLSHRAVKSVIRHPNQTLVDPHTDLPQQISTDHYQRAVSRLMFVITPGTVRGFKYVTTREKW